MRAHVRREVLSPCADPRPLPAEAVNQLALVGSWVQLCGRGFGHRATGTVDRVTGPYVGADYHVCLDVTVQLSASSGALRRERWFVRWLDLGDA